MGHLFSNWNFMDFIIVGIVLFSVIVSFFRGFLREAISLLSWFLAFYAALKFSPSVSGIFQAAISEPKTRYIVSAALIFVIVLLLGVMVNKLAHALVTTTGLGFFDKILGFVFGAARGLLFVTIILLIVQASPFQQASWMKQSQLSPHFQPIVKHFSQLLPKEIKTVSHWMNQLTAIKQ